MVPHSNNRYEARMARSDSTSGYPGVLAWPSRRCIEKWVMRFKIPGGERVQVYYPATKQGAKDAYEAYCALREKYDLPIPIRIKRNWNSINTLENLKKRSKK